MPLFRAAAAVVAADPDAFPIRHPVLLVITSSEPLLDLLPEHGYSVDSAIDEVLVDARLLDDEGVAEWLRYEIRRGMRGYSIHIEESPYKSHQIGGVRAP